MLDDPFIPILITEWALAGLVAFVLLQVGYELQNSSGKTKNGVVVVSYGAFWKVLMIVSMVGITAGLIACHLDGGPTWVKALFAGMLVVGVVGCAEFFRCQVHLLDEGLHRVSIWRGRTTLPWSQIRVVRWSEAAKWLYIRTDDGRTARISELMNGRAKVAEALLDRVTPRAWDRATLERLREWREGQSR